MRLDRFQPTIQFLEEPTIEVGEGVSAPEPKMGWTLVGPLGSQTATYAINLGLIGDANSIEGTKNLIRRLNSAAYGSEKNFLHLEFPGISRFRIALNVEWIAQIDADSTKKQIESTGSFPERVEVAARIIKEKINELMEDRDPAPEVLILAYPKIIDYYCIEQAVGHRGLRRKTKVEKFIEKVRSRHISLDRFFEEPPAAPFKPYDLRSMVKAICMQYNVPIQILRPVTTEPYNPERPQREEDATTFWNLVVALFYKANHIPWRVHGLMSDTCYLGVSFFKDRDDVSNVRTALAQVFAIDSEGYVFKRGKATVDEYNAPHVTKDDASGMAGHAVSVFARNNLHPPRRLVVHKTSRFTPEEIEGFRAGITADIKLDLVAFGSRSIKLVRWGMNPPPRGTMVRLPDQSVILYTFGYIPYLDAYPGPRVPAPLEILEHHGATQIDTICREILALTKLNWNNAKFCTKAPITIGFARRVGSILRNLPPDTDLADRFKFYM